MGIRRKRRVRPIQRLGPTPCYSVKKGKPIPKSYTVCDEDLVPLVQLYLNGGRLQCCMHASPMRGCGRGSVGCSARDTEAGAT